MTNPPSFLFRFCFGIALSALFLSGPVLNAETNLLTNPGFESGNTTGWTTWGSTLAASTVEKRSGSYSGLVTNRTADWQTAVINALPLVTAGKTYRFSAWVKLAPGATSSFSAVLDLTDANPRSYTTLQTVSATSSGWTEVSGTFTYEPTGTATAFYINFSCADPTRNLYLDDASLVEVDPLANLLTNPGFESGNTNGWSGVGSTITASTTEKRSGEYGGYVTGRTAEWNGAWIDNLQTVLTSGKTYRVSVWIKPAAGSAITVQLTSKQTNGGEEIYGPVLQEKVCTAGEWSELSGGFTYINPGNTTALSFYIFCTDPTRSYAIDDAEVRIEELTVDLAVTGAPATQKATGFLHGLGDTAPSADYYEPLKPRIQRFPAFLANPNMLGAPSGFGSPAYMNRLKAVGAIQQIVVSDEYMWFGHHISWGWPGDPAHDGYTPYQILDEKLDSIVDYALANFPASEGWQIEWDLWNEPDLEMFWGRSQAQFFETWKHAYQKVRSKDPNAVIVGPSIGYFVTKGDNPVQGGWLKEFLIYARDNNVLPDIVSWHEMVNPKEIPAQVQLIREFMAANDIANRPIDVNEYQGPGENLMLSPGNTISFLSSFETTDIRHAIRACWNEDAAQADGTTNGLFPGRLDNIMTMAPFQPRAQWHVYRSYADMSGHIVPVSRGGFLSAVASRDAASGKAHILVGNDGTSSFPTNVNITNLSELTNFPAGQMRVTVREIPYSGLSALSAPTEVSNEVLTPDGDEIVVPLNVTSRGAYEITLQAIGPKTTSTASGNWNAPLTWSNGVPVDGGATGIVNTVNFQAGDAWVGGTSENGLLIGYDSWGTTWGLGGTGSGILNVTGGTLTTGFLGLGAGLNGGNQTGTLNISDGIVTVTDQMRIGWSTTPGSSVNVSGGVLNLNGEENIIGYGAAAAMTVTGGTVHLNGPLLANNSSTLLIGGTGVMSINSLGALSASPTIEAGGTLRFNGGTGNSANNLSVEGGTVDVNGQNLATGTWANWLPTADGNRLMNSSSSPAVIANGNTIWLWNTPSLNTTIEAVGNLTIDAWITGFSGHHGGITKAGAGVLTLTNPTNDYTGHTVVNAGTLRLNHPTLANAADVRLSSGAVLNLNFAGTDTIRRLIIDGSQQAGGTWGAVGSAAQHQSPLITGTGLLQVSSGADFSTWASENNIASTAPDADDDGNGIKNLMEYALGLTPATSSAAMGVLDGNTMTFTKGAAAVANGDVNFEIQTSTSLAPDSWSTVTPTVDSPSEISYDIPAGPPKVFIRLKVTQIP